jgi:hypothetical protein
MLYYAQHYGYLAETVEKPLVCAHRGDNVNAPDNSYEAFELAVSEGVPWLELDVQKDRNIWGAVMIHFAIGFLPRCFGILQIIEG